MECGKLSVQEVAEFMRVDKQTIRVMLQSGAVDWGVAFKPPGSTHYNYVIYAKRFCDATGYKPK